MIRAVAAGHTYHGSGSGVGYISLYLKKAHRGMCALLFHALEAG